MSRSQMDDYVRAYFRTWAEFTEQIGAPEETVADLIAAGAAPGPIYSLEPDGSWWSALAAYKGEVPPEPSPDGQHWYARSAIWWLRRAALHVRGGMTGEAAAKSNLDHFEDQFRRAIAAEPYANERFPGCGNSDGSREAAGREWGDWLKGGYAVCMMSFSGSSCVQKEVCVVRLRAMLQDGRAAEQDLLELAERLSALVLPFGPMERAASSAGLIDQSLSRLSLGFEHPYR